ncbi:MAG: RnfABCDGE type electron transport complex subunit B [candidate division KSB1 bacterium]|nr:RnfABCDGE type electron transport complex subunit B [candidate division KSB1 bacterium]
MFFGTGLAFASKKFAVETDPKVDEILNELPGANCGACGYPGCNAYAEAAAKGEAPANLCTPGGETVAQSISNILGISNEPSGDPKVAVVCCQGDNNNAVSKFHYQGIHDCHAAELVGGGHKACEYGCLGLGSCVESCPFDALSMGDKGLPIVDEEKCTACGICVTTCPRGIMQLIPRQQNVYLACVSQDKAKAVKSVCKVGCFACKICTTPKVTTSEAITMQGNLPKIQDIDSDDLYTAVEKCPANCYVIRDQSYAEQATPEQTVQ